MRSFSQRLLISVSLLLVLSFGVMVAVLDERFRAVSATALHDLLDAQMVALVTSADPDETGNVVPRLANAESRLATPGSGLYAAVRSGTSQPSWRSPSSEGSLVDFGPPLQPGQREFRYLTDLQGNRIAAVSRGLRWEGDHDVVDDLTFTVATDLAAYNQQLQDFRRGLLGGFGAMTALLLLALAGLLRWALAPLRRLALQIREVEHGGRDQLGDRWPIELRGVVGNLNTLLAGERTRIARYRTTLGNLAHSLKTPLAVLRSTAGGAAGPLVNEQVDRMSAIVEHQLQRAATSGGTSVGRQAVDVLPLGQDLRATLLRVHGYKDFALELAIPAQVQFVGDRNDLTETLGNLMDNAAKWCRAQVRVSAAIARSTDNGSCLLLSVEDDGPGIAPADRTRAMERGARIDEHVPGHGLGLAMVRDMVELYGGSIELSESALGGARVDLRLPGRMR
ncbi:MAG: ATP-binding protein [Pseudomonadota bacterium]